MKAVHIQTFQNVKTAILKGNPGSATVKQVKACNLNDPDVKEKGGKNKISWRQITVNDVMRRMSVDSKFRDELEQIVKTKMGNDGNKISKSVTLASVILSDGEYQAIPMPGDRLVRGKLAKNEITNFKLTQSIHFKCMLLKNSIS